LVFVAENEKEARDTNKGMKAA